MECSREEAKQQGCQVRVHSGFSPAGSIFTRQVIMHKAVTGFWRGPFPAASSVRNKNES